MNEMSLSEKLTYSTVFIKCLYKDGTEGAGTGFIVELCNNKETGICIPVLITNKHVTKNSVQCVFEFCIADSNGKPKDKEAFSFRYDNQSWIMHPDNNVDLCCLRLGPALNEISKTDNKIFYIPLTTDIIPSQKQIDELTAMEDVVMIGYPIGLSDFYNHKPILRRGSTATHIKNDYQGKKEFLVDMACFPGSSGSPILILNQGTYTIPTGIAVGSRLYLVGILYGGPEFSATGVISFANLPKMPTPIINIPVNLGVAIKASEILAFEDVLINMNGGISNGQT